MKMYDIEIVNDHFSGGARRFSLWRAGAVGPLDEAGPHRSEHAVQRVAAVGIPRLQAGEDVNDWLRRVSLTDTGIGDA